MVTIKETIQETSFCLISLESVIDDLSKISGIEHFQNIS